MPSIMAATKKPKPGKPRSTPAGAKRKDASKRPAGKGAASRQARQAEPPKPPPHGTAEASAAAPEDRSSERVVALLHKTVELLETGVNLGISLAGRFGDLAKEQLAQGLMGASVTGAPAAEESPGPGPSRREDAGPAPEAPYQGNLGVVNRLPLYPGSPVQVSFSINNDTPSSPKELQLAIEGFVGSAHKQKIDASGFSVLPPRTVIAPMDFEKFMLAGTIPADLAADAYSGWVIVTGEEGFRIPVTLLVSPKP
jgi:hypothetical protein